MIETKRVPDGSAWGVLPSQATKGETSEATGSYNVMVHSFTPSALKGVLFFRTPEAFESEQAEAHFKLLMKSWNERFGSTPNWASLRSDLKADVLAEAIRQVTE